MKPMNECKNASRCLWALPCVIFLLLGGSASAQSTLETQADGTKAAPFTPVVVEAVTIQSGNELGADETAKLEQSLKGEAYTEKWIKQLTDKVTRRLWDDGYLDAAAKPTVRPLNIVDGEQHVAVSVDLNAGPRYTIVGIWWTGSSVFTTKQLNDIILPRVGEVLRFSSLGESDVLLRKAYAGRGYPAAFAFIESQKYPETGNVALYIEMHEGEKSSGSEPASVKQSSCTTPTLDEIRKVPFTPRTVSYDPKVDAQIEIERAKLEAQRTNRKVLLIAGGEWCGWCHVLDQTFELSPALRQLRDRDFVTVHVNVSEENQNACAMRGYPAPSGYPFFYVVDAQGKLIATSDTREFESTYGYDRARIEDFLKKW